MNIREKDLRNLQDFLTIVIDDFLPLVAPSKQIVETRPSISSGIDAVYVHICDGHRWTSWSITLEEWIEVLTGSFTPESRTACACAWIIKTIRTRRAKALREFLQAENGLAESNHPTPEQPADRGNAG